MGKGEKKGGWGRIREKLGTVARTFKPSTQEAEVAGRSLNFRPAWSTEQDWDSQSHIVRSCLKGRKKERKKEK